MSTATCTWMHACRHLLRSHVSTCMLVQPRSCGLSCCNMPFLALSLLPPPQAYAKDPRIQWVQEWPGQVVLCVDMIYWTAEVHEAIRLGPKGLQDYSKKLQSQVCAHGYIVQHRKGRGSVVRTQACSTAPLWSHSNQLSYCPYYHSCHSFVGADTAAHSVWPLPSLPCM